MAGCEWQSATIKRSDDDGSLLTSYRIHYDQRHLPSPNAVIVDLDAVAADDVA